MDVWTKQRKSMMTTDYGYYDYDDYYDYYDCYYDDDYFTIMRSMMTTHYATTVWLLRL